MSYVHDKPGSTPGNPAPYGSRNFVGMQSYPESAPGWPAALANTGAYNRRPGGYGAEGDAVTLPQPVPQTSDSFKTFIVLLGLGFLLWVLLDRKGPQRNPGRNRRGRFTPRRRRRRRQLPARDELGRFLPSDEED